VRRFKLDSFLDKWYSVENGGATVRFKKDRIDGYYIFILGESDFSQVKSPLKFEYVITGSGGWLAVGAGIESIITKTRPKWNYSKHLETGVYILANNKYVGAHGDEKNNGLLGFEYGDKAVIQVEYNPIDQTLTFRKQNSSNTEKLVLHKVLPDARPCVIMVAKGNSVTIR
jgi:hypothetical protein